MKVIGECIVFTCLLQKRYAALILVLMMELVKYLVITLHVVVLNITLENIVKVINVS